MPKGELSVYGGKCLDIATGAGNSIAVIRELSDNIKSITGIDISEKNISRAREKNKGKDIDFIIMDGENMLFDDQSFDLVSICNSLHHFTNPIEVLNEAFRVLKNNGNIIIMEMFSDNQNEKQLTHVFIHHWWAEIDTALNIPHNLTFKKQDIIDMILNAGFINIQTEIIDNTENEPDIEILNQMHEHIETYLKKAEQLPAYESIKLEGMRLKQRIDDVGFAYASQILLIGEKS